MTSIPGWSPAFLPSLPISVCSSSSSSSDAIRSLGYGEERRLNVGWCGFFWSSGRMKETLRLGFASSTTGSTMWCSGVSPPGDERLVRWALFDNLDNFFFNFTTRSSRLNDFASSKLASVDAEENVEKERKLGRDVGDGGTFGNAIEFLSGTGGGGRVLSLLATALFVSGSSLRG